MPPPSFNTLNEITHKNILPEYQVNEPCKFLCWGFFYPLSGMPKLHIFDSKDLEQQLRQIAQMHLVDKIRIKVGFLSLRFPKFLKWFIDDFDTSRKRSLDDMLKFIHYE